MTGILSGAYAYAMGLASSLEMFTYLQMLPKARNQETALEVAAADAKSRPTNMLCAAAISNTRCYEYANLTLALSPMTS